MLNVANIIKESIVDGDGLRYVVFVQGCLHNCVGCQNPDTHSFKEHKLLEINDILNDMKQNPLLDGITLSGGDPFFQAEQSKELAKACKEEGYNIWVYTGFIFDEFLKYMKHEKCNSLVNDEMIDFLNYIDVLVDGPFILEQKTLNKKFVGSSNQRLIDVVKSLKANKVIEYNLE